jgi:hypothetical protein
MHRTLLLTALLALAAAPAADAKRGAKTVDKNKRLWATVNICDSEQSPDTIGIRASMPGSGKKGERRYMRFRVQDHSPADGRWHNFLAEGADSGYQRVGSAKYRARQSGWTFPFDLQPGQRYELRGVVNFEWRKGRKVVRKAAKRTTKGHRTSLAEPKRYSAATCVISG